MRESSLVTYNKNPIAFDAGTIDRVEFNFDKVWEFINDFKKNYEFNPDHLRFYHVHSNKSLEYSEGDFNSLKAINKAFDCSMYFSIITFEYEKLDMYHHKNLEFNQISYKLIDDKMKKVDNVELCTSQIFLLKAGSYL